MHVRTAAIECYVVCCAAATGPANQARLLQLLTAASTTRRTGATGDATKALLRELNARCACEHRETAAGPAAAAACQQVPISRVARACSHIQTTCNPRGLCPNAQLTRQVFMIAAARVRGAAVQGRVLPT